MFRMTTALLLLAFAATASAQDIDYNYLQLDYGNVDFDDINVDGDGFGVSGSFEINPDWHIFGGYQSVDLDFGVDVSTLGIGIGRVIEMSPGVDLYGRASFQRIDFDSSGGASADDTGLGLGVGLRYMASRELEITGGIDYVDFDDAGNDTAFSIGGLYSLNEDFAIGLGGSWSDDVSSYTLSGRYYFGK